MDDLIRYLRNNFHEQRCEVQRKIGKKGEHVLLAGVVLELAAKVAAWISLSQRAGDEVRGPRWAWALGFFVNGTVPAAYLFSGRK